MSNQNWLILIVACGIVSLLIFYIGNLIITRIRKNIYEQELNTLHMSWRNRERLSQEINYDEEWNKLHKNHSKLFNYNNYPINTYVPNRHDKKNDDEISRSRRL